MLNLSNSLVDATIKYLIIMKVKTNRGVYRKVELKNYIEKLKYSIIRAAVDAFVVGGIVFFSSMLSLGFSDILMNLRFALISSTLTVGLSFFTELRKILEGKNRI